MQKTILKKDEFVNEVIRIEEQHGFKIENNQRNGQQQIDFKMHPQDSNILLKLH